MLQHSVRFSFWRSFGLPAQSRAAEFSSVCLSQILATCSGPLDFPLNACGACADTRDRRDGARRPDCTMRRVGGWRMHFASSSSPELNRGILYFRLRPRLIIHRDLLPPISPSFLLDGGARVGKRFAFLRRLFAKQRQRLNCRPPHAPSNFASTTASRTQTVFTRHKWPVPNRHPTRMI